MLRRPAIPVMKATDFPYRDHLAVLRQFDLARDRRDSIERETCSVLGIISDVQAEDPLEMPFGEHNDVTKLLMNFFTTGSAGNLRIHDFPTRRAEPRGDVSERMDQVGARVPQCRSHRFPLVQGQLHKSSAWRCQG